VAISAVMPGPLTRNNGSKECYPAGMFAANGLLINEPR